MKLSVAEKELKKVLGCLADQRTPDSVARRRHPNGIEEMLGAHQTPWALDCDKIKTSLAFRRARAKTQVMHRPNHGHISSRSSHMLEVARTAKTIATILGLNSDLAEAIALAHDLGHPPFGHLAERMINDVLGSGKPKFNHERFGCVNLQHLETTNRGLNLSRQVLLGIMEDELKSGAFSVSDSVILPEMIVAGIADSATYLWGDIEDTTRGYEVEFAYRELPTRIKNKIRRLFGATRAEQTHNTILEICLESAGVGTPSFKTSPAAEHFQEIKRAMYEYVYHDTGFNLWRGQDVSNAREVFLHLQERTNNAVPLFASLTDRELHSLMEELRSGGKEIGWRQTAAYEIIRPFEENGVQIDYANPDLDW